MAAVRKLIDIGVNLTDPMFKGIYNGTAKHAPDIENVILRGTAQGVSKMIITGGSLEESKAALELAKTNNALFSTVGCHPTRCLEFESDPNQTPESYLSELIALASAQSKKVVAVGEIGLDYDRLHFCPKDIQLKYFEKQLDVADNTRLPLFLHCRNAADDVYEILAKNRERWTGGVIHSFDGCLAEAEKFIDLNLFIGINGCSLKTEANLEVVAKLPLDKLMIETDSPWCEIKASHAGFEYIVSKFESKKKEKFLSNQQVKGRNEPQNLVQVLEVIAGVREESIDDLAKAVTANTEKLFRFELLE